MKINIVLTCISFVFTMMASGQSPKIWTLQECINHAINNNIQVKRQELNRQYYENNYLRSKMSVLPGVNAGVNQNFSFGRTVDPFTNDFITDNTVSNDFYLQARLNLFNGLQTYNSIQKRKFEMLQNEYVLNKTKNDISLEVALAYLEILFNNELLGISQSQQEVTQLQLERTKKLVEVGNLAQGELLEIEAQLARERWSVLNNKNELKNSYLNLTQLLELDSIGDFTILFPDTINLEETLHIESVEMLFQQSLTHMPEIKRDEYNLKSREKDLNIAQGQRSPSLSLRGSYYTGYSDAREQISDIVVQDRVTGYVEGNTNVPVTLPVETFVFGNYPFSDQFRDNAYKSLSFNLTIPIFNQYQVQTSINNSRLGVLDAKYQLDLTKKNLYKTIQQAHTDAIAAYENFQASQKAMDSYKEAFNYTEQKFDVGLVSSVDYNLAKNNLVKAESEMLQAKYEYLFKTKILDFYTGKPLALY